MTFAVAPARFLSLAEAEHETFSDLDTARDAAFDWSIDEGGAEMIIWRLTSGNPIKWMAVCA